ncbi:charged multivesicular body protein 7 [Harmonia axyridis]|uniref:charged multivesicular body protein 7 n=1 Tax=Harmonia axyridis TaxID=115357 RepID=UPI001E276DD8|nr:charged multivesicular body protein 7 [Harmonia axyridis]
MVLISTDNLPDFFKDEKRRNVLYAPLRSKTANPNDWNFKITSWKQLINLYCSSNKTYYFSLESLKVAFHDNGRTPSCLEEVLQNMSLNKEIEPLAVFMEKKPKTWAAWATKSLISTPLTWSLNKMKNIILSPELSKLEYAALNIIHQEADLLLNELSSNHKNEILTLEEIMKEKNLEINKQKDVEILILSLYNRNKVDILETQTGSLRPENLLIKVCDPNHFEPISEVDLGIRTLKANEKALEKNIEFLTDSANKCREEAKSHLVRGQKQLAKASLKKKHEIEKRIDKKTETLCNINILWNKLHDATLGEEVLDSYKNAVKAFEGTLKKGMNTDAIDDTMVKVAEMLEIQSDMENALGRPVIDVDEDLEKELEDLLAEDKFNDENKGSPGQDSDESLIKAMEKMELNLPSVPSSPISIGDLSQNMSSQVN